MLINELFSNGNGLSKDEKIMTVLGDLDDDSFIFNTNRDDVI